MFASHTTMQFKPGGMDAVLADMDKIAPDIKSLDGLKHFFVLKSDDTTGVVVAIYENQQAQEAANPKVLEILGGMAEHLASPPDRKGCEVVYNLNL